MFRTAPRNCLHFAVALLGVAVVASAPLLAATPINQSRPLDPRGRIEIENHKGRIEVRAWDRPEVKIEGSLGDGVEKLEIDGNRQHLVIRVKYPDRGSGLGFLVGGDRSAPTELRLMVPLEADLDIASVAADIDVSGVAPGELQIDSVSGDVVLRGRLGAKVDVETVSGRIDVAVRDTAVRELSGATVSGDLRIATALDGNGRIKLESVSGDIDLNLPRDVSANVRGESFSGDLRAADATIIRPKHGPGSTFEHRYGSGSGKVSIETFSGDARLQLD